MKMTNLHLFLAATASDPALATQLEALRVEAPAEAADKVARLATEAGFPVSADEVEAWSGPNNELDDEALEQVAGGGYSREDFERARRELAEEARTSNTLMLFGECRRP